MHIYRDIWMKIYVIYMYVCTCIGNYVYVNIFIFLRRLYIHLYIHIYFYVGYIFYINTYLYLCRFSSQGRQWCRTNSCRSTASSLRNTGLYVYVYLHMDTYTYLYRNKFILPHIHVFYAYCCVQFVWVGLYI
jgi:hypothetical protein